VRKSNKRECRHCKMVRWPQGRGLCKTCFYTPGVRTLYPFLPMGRPNEWVLKGEGTSDDMTEAELDAVIAEQMACLPEWWDKAYGPSGPPGTSCKRISKIFSKVLRLPICTGAMTNDGRSV
jgi:hypothetical protein